MRIVRWLAVLALVVTGLALVEVPAEAHNDACVGQGIMSTTSEFFTGSPSTSALFNIFMVTGDCALGSVPAPAGSITGTCERATGTGVDTGHAFAVEWIGSSLIFSGAIQGVLHVVPDVISGGSCLTGADRFVVTGSYNFVH